MWVQKLTNPTSNANPVSGIYPGDTIQVAYDYADANYGSSEAMTVALSIAYDNANQVVGGGVGSTGSLVGRAFNGSATGVTTQT